jgi:hypothetical protein
MAMPTNIPAGINVTTTPGQYWTDEDGVSHYTGDVYNYTDQSGSQVFYTPPILTVGQDDNGTGAGEIARPEQWTVQGAQNGYDEEGNPSYASTPYLAPNASIEDMLNAKGLGAYSGPLGAMLQSIENANPNDTLFTPETFDRMNQTQMGRFGNYSSTESLTDLMNKAVQAAGAPDYATSDAAQIDKVPAVQAFNQGQTDKWNNQQKDTGTVFGDLSTIIDIAANFALPIAGPAIAEYINSRGDLSAAAKAAATSFAAQQLTVGSGGGAVDPYADFGGPGYSADINSSLNNAAAANAAAANADFANTIPPAFNDGALPSYPSGGGLSNSTIPNYSATSYPITPQVELQSSNLTDPFNTTPPPPVDISTSYNPMFQKLAGQFAVNAATNGGDLEKALKSTLIGAGTGAIGSTVADLTGSDIAGRIASNASRQLANTGDVNLTNIAGSELGRFAGNEVAGSTGSNFLGNAAANTASSLVSGQDPTNSLKNLVANTLINKGYDAATQTAIDLAKNVDQSPSSGALSQVKTQAGNDVSQQDNAGAAPTDNGPTGGLNAVSAADQSQENQTPIVANPQPSGGGLNFLSQMIKPVVTGAIKQQVMPQTPAKVQARPLPPQKVSAAQLAQMQPIPNKAPAPTVNAAPAKKANVSGMTPITSIATLMKLLKLKGKA